MSDIYIGIDLGGTFIKVGCFDSQLKLIYKTSVPVEADIKPEAMVELIGRTIEKILADNNLGKKNLRSIGIGSTGQFNLADGFMISNPNLTSFKNVPLRKMLVERLGKPVVIDNDGNAACWGEYTLGTGKGVKDMVFFTLGTGIGGGIITNGNLMHGFADNAAELGHIIIYPNGRKCGCGQNGCAEAYASAKSTAKRAKEAIDAGAKSSLKNIIEKKGEITAKDVYEQLKAGDALAKEIADGTAEALAILCINMLHTTDPQRIIFSGGMIAAGDILLDRIKYYFNKHIWSIKPETVEICFATLGEDVGIIGAAALAQQIQKQK
jgi:glucokinase